MLAAALVVGGCTLGGTFRPETHIVEQGDTLYSIAWRYGVDWKTLARWNDLNPPYTIYPGQRLTLSRYGAPPTRTAGGDAGSTSPSSPPESDAPAESVTERAASDAAEPDDNETRTESGTETAAATAAESEAAAVDRRWQWPADGKVLRRYSGSRHGIDIGGETGAPVRATGGGRVVYSGSGLRGYGNLVIIKHDQQYLSAYGYNRRLLVEQGADVAAGDQIAEMGIGPEQVAAVHFEIRREGRPLDPSRILPSR